MDKGLLERLHQTVRECWSAETSADAEVWTAQKPSWGQCAVTACLVQDFFGGEILWALAVTPDDRRHSHYFNRLSDGSVLDLTYDQFPPGTELAPRGGCPRLMGLDGRLHESTRDYILSYPATNLRYERLRTEVGNSLSREPVTNPACSPRLLQNEGCENPGQ